MKDKSIYKLLLIFWFILAIISIYWIIFSISNHQKYMFGELIYRFFFIITCFSLFISYLSIHQVFGDIKKRTDEIKQKEKNVRTVYDYFQLLDPPSINN